MFFYIFIIFAIIFLVFLLSMVWPPDSPWAPWWRTSKKTAHVMCKLANIKSSDVIYDLGSGEGTALFVAAKEFGAEGVGIEIDLIRYWYSKVLKYLKNEDKVNFIRGNIFDSDLSKASVIFVYLVPKTLGRLKTKFLKELKPGVRIVSYKYEIDLPLIAYDKRNKLRVYKIPRSI